MTPQAWIGRAKNVGYEMKLGYGRLERRQHEIPNAQCRQAGYGLSAGWDRKNKQENLAYVVVALEVAKIGVSPQDLDDQVRQLVLLTG